MSLLTREMDNKSSGVSREAIASMTGYILRTSANEGAVVRLKGVYSTTGRTASFRVPITSSTVSVLDLEQFLSSGIEADTVGKEPLKILLVDI